MNALKALYALFGIFVTAPIWYYLVHFMLVHAGATDLQMFLFWIYVPVGVFLHIVGAIIAAMKD